MIIALPISKSSRTNRSDRIDNEGYITIKSYRLTYGDQSGQRYLMHLHFPITENLIGFSVIIHMGCRDGRRNDFIFWNMIVFVCEKCKYTDLLEGVMEHICPRCGGVMLSLGVDSADWNRLDGIERDEKINAVIPDAAKEEADGSGKSDHPEAVIEQEPDKMVDPEIDDTKSRPAEDHNTRAGGRVKKVSYATGDTASKGTRDYSYKSYMDKKKPRPKPHIRPGFVLAAVMVVCLLFALNEQLKGKAGVNASDTGASEKTTFAPVEKKAHDEAYDFDNCLYYDSISEEDKEIYRIAYDLVMHKDERGYDRSITMDSFEFAQRQNSLFHPIHAMLADHPEFFYLQSNGRNFGVHTIMLGSVYTVTFTLGEGEADENDKIKRFEKATRDFMNGIDLNTNDFEVEKQIHDKLIELVAYDYDLLDRDIENGDLGFTAYGALVEDSYGLRNQAVCGGYAQAFQYLLGQAGIEAAYVTGYADSESGTLSEQGSHAWNLVKLDGEWYEVDSCWDDIDPPPNSPDKDLYKIIKYEPQYGYATHHWFNRTTEEMRFLPEGINTTFRVRQGNTIHELQPCSRSTHQRKRDSAEDDYDLFLYLDHYLPQAMGTKYAYNE